MPDEQNVKTSETLLRLVGWQVDDLQGITRMLSMKICVRLVPNTSCGHARVGDHLPARRVLLDAGSGPVQWPAYLAYSLGYKHRVCMDLSYIALLEARKRLGEHGLYVVGDLAHLPFKTQAFDGIVALHAIHHLPAAEKPACYRGLYARLKPGGRGHC